MADSVNLDAELRRLMVTIAHEMYERRFVTAPSPRPKERRPANDLKDVLRADEQDERNRDSQPADSVRILGRIRMEFNE